jgi:hypothetical protein
MENLEFKPNFFVIERQSELTQALNKLQDVKVLYHS